MSKRRYKQIVKAEDSDAELEQETRGWKRLWAGLKRKRGKRKRR